LNFGLALTRQNAAKSFCLKARERLNFMPDLELKCVQCQQVFNFSEKEQETFYRRNLPQPQRCHNCRPTRRKAAQTAANGNGQTRYEIICDVCGKKDFVPFAPKVGRTISCSECYTASRSRTRFA
jgi:CxxC-x17-CxxC domain-containing protein